MSVTTTSRVDATTPVLAQLVDASTKGFTGSLEVSSKDSTGRDLRVVVWFEDGAVCAVHTPGWVPPAAEYVLHRTGYDFSGRGESPFKLAYETGGMRNTGTESHGSDWPTSHSTVPMQVSVGTPRRQPRSCRRRSPSAADRLPRSGLLDKA